jgi:hypothetical protein
MLQFEAKDENGKFAASAARSPSPAGDPASLFSSFSQSLAITNGFVAPRPFAALQTLDGQGSNRVLILAQRTTVESFTHGRGPHPSVFEG